MVKNWSFFHLSYFFSSHPCAPPPHSVLYSAGNSTIQVAPWPVLLRLLLRQLHERLPPGRDDAVGLCGTAQTRLYRHIPLPHRAQVHLQGGGGALRAGRQSARGEESHRGAAGQPARQLPPPAAELRLREGFQRAKAHPQLQGVCTQGGRTTYENSVL